MLDSLDTCQRIGRKSAFSHAVLILCICSGIWLDGFAASTVQSQRQIVIEAIQQRPGDPWPRGLGHVILGLPGSLEANKAYHEPGGSFSPSTGSFGVSLWITDNDGNLKATSDDIPLDQIKQQWLWTDPRGMPGLLTDTPYYRSTWSFAGIGLWQLQLHIKTNADTKTWMVVRGVGPAGGPVQSLVWNGTRLLVNGRWVVTCDPVPAAVQLSHEGQSGWIKATSPNRQWNGQDGWGYARFALPGVADRRILIRDPVAVPATGLAISSLRATLELTLPDERFAACLNAQVSQLMMGLVGRETRPGDPTHYPLNWLRHGAFIIAALAQAGQLDVARQLTIPFADTDFFGGFGPEADGPGLALWGMGIVAERLGQPQYNLLMWPQASRKGNLITQMRATEWPIFKPVVGPVLPQYANNPELGLVCERPRNGLIVGKVDSQRPLLYVNAVSYRGLLEAAAFGDRVANVPAAASFRRQAADLKLAWARAFQTAISTDESALAYGLWPTWVVTDKPAYAQELQARWERTRDGQGRFRDPPRRPYVELGESHQWLSLGNVERPWTTLKWFWDNQSSPGLYTWWDGQGEENTFNLWDRVRGWVKPPSVTPHYRTAAEMLLLQLDMLASVDLSGAEPVLIVGAGIPPEWLNKPMRVRGLSTHVGLVDWNWNLNAMQVILRGRRCPVRLGPAFPPNTPLRVQ